MLNLEAAQVHIGSPFKVEPSNNLFEELGNNTYDYKDLLSELIDNSLAASYHDRIVNINISLRVSDSDPSKNALEITDDARGISRERLGEAISPAAVQASNSLNEHGLGMKQAIAGLGTLRYLATKTSEDKHATVVEQFKFGDIFPKEVDVPWDSGTSIVIHKLKPIVRLHPISYTRDLAPYLGARYRRFLMPDKPRARIRLAMLDVDNDDHEIQQWVVTAVKPTYFHPNRRTNTPVVFDKVFKGVGWDASLVFGYAPEGHEWQELGLEEPSKFEPYAVSLSKQGFDIILNDRVIMFHQLPELNFVGTRHNNYNHVRGEIILRTGFTTAITKNSVIHEEHWTKCMSEIKEFLDEKKLIKSKTYPDALPESALRDRLANWLSTNNIARRKNVQREWPVEGLGGQIDVLADGEVWEIKCDEATGMDVYQLFAYMDTAKTDVKKGYLLAKSHKESARYARDHIAKKHKLDITLDLLENYPINQPLTEKEMAEYL